MTRFRIVLASLVVGAATAVAAGQAAQPQATDPTVDALRKDLFFLAGPDCEGRGIDTKGIDRAADYIAEAFRAAGLRPAAKDGSFFQPFTVTMGAKLGSPNKLAFSGPAGKELVATVPAEASPLGFSRTGAVKGGAAFVGYGITAPKLKYDDYAGIDVAGKVVVVLRKTPKPDRNGKDRFDATVPEGEDSPLATLQSKIENAAAHKAAGVVFVSDRVSAGKRDDLLAFAVHAQGTLPAPFPVFHVKREFFDKLLMDAGSKPLEEVEKAIEDDLKPQSAVLAGWTTDAQITATRTEAKVKNVVGVLDGSGPLADETVVIGAHYDHLGYGTFGSLGGAGASGKVHFGADDNASGTSGLLELARRFGATKERRGRRLVFVAFTAEERGLYGSIHYCKEPSFPLEATAAMVNMDMIGRVVPVAVDWLGLWPERKDRLVLYGTGTGDTLDGMADGVNAKGDFKLYKVPGGNAPTDSDTFYRKRVPVLFFFSGTHPDYHRPTDLPEKINLSGLKKVADLVQHFVERLAVESRPKFLVTKGGWEDPTDDKPRPRGGPRMGIMPGNYEEADKGVLIGGLAPGGAAEKAGLKEGDLIVEIGGKPVKNIGGYMSAMAGQKPGLPVGVKVLRKGQEATVQVTPQ